MTEKHLAWAEQDRQAEDDADAPWFWTCVCGSVSASEYGPEDAWTAAQEHEETR